MRRRPTRQAGLLGRGRALLAQGRRRTDVREPDPAQEPQPWSRPQPCVVGDHAAFVLINRFFGPNLAVAADLNVRIPWPALPRGGSAADGQRPQTRPQP